MFVGVKEWVIICVYECEGGIIGFFDFIDWGWFFFLIKLIFVLLYYLNELIGNMGWVIIGLIVIIKIVFFLLVYCLYVFMVKMKEL